MLQNNRNSGVTAGKSSVIRNQAPRAHWTTRYRVKLDGFGGADYRRGAAHLAWSRVGTERETEKGGRGKALKERTGHLPGDLLVLIYVFHVHILLGTRAK